MLWNALCSVWEWQKSASQVPRPFQKANWVVGSTPLICINRPRRTDMRRSNTLDNTDVMEIGFADDSTLMESPGVRVAVAESLIRDLGRVSEWCDLWGMKLKVSKTKTVIVSRSRTMNLQSPLLTIGGTALKESDDLVILRVTFDSKMTFEKHISSVPRAASERLGILIRSWRVFHD